MTSFLDLPYEGADPVSDAREKADRVSKATKAAEKSVGAFVLNASSKAEAEARLGLPEVRGHVLTAATSHGVPVEAVERALIRHWVGSRKAAAKPATRKKAHPFEDVVKELGLDFALEAALGDSVHFYSMAHGAHWNVIGSDFPQFHALFKDIYEDVYSAIDPLAENMRKRGAAAPADFTNLYRSIGVMTPGVESGLVLAQALSAANAELIELLKAAFNAADRENEQGIANFLAERIDMHQKWAWQLDATTRTAKKAAKTAAKFPVEVQLTGEDGNAFFILGKVIKALRKAGATPEQVKQFETQATSGDYDNLLRVCMEWVEVL